MAWFKILAGHKWALAVLGFIAASSNCGCRYPSLGGTDDELRVVIPLLPTASHTARLDLGEISLGSRFSLPVCLQNRRGHAIEAARFESSCECLALDFGTGSFPADTVSVIRGRLIVDLTGKPDISGDLAVEIKGYDASGEILLNLLVLVSVDRPAVDIAEGKVPEPVSMTIQP